MSKDWITMVSSSLSVLYGRVARFVRFLGEIPKIPLIILLVVFMCGLFPDFLAPHSPYKLQLEINRMPPFWQDGGSIMYPLGTDKLGRDLLSRIIFGARVSLTVGIVAVSIGGIIGSAVGIVSGYIGGRTDAILMRVVDSFIAFPIILIALLLVVTLGASFANVIFAMFIILWARYARVIRGEVLSIKQRDFVSLAVVANCSKLRIMVKHIFPHTLNTLLVLLTLQVGWVILIEAALSFLGAGVPPPHPAWGSIVASGRDEMAICWWISTLPGVAILLTVMTFNLLGDWLRDRLDPKLRQL